MLLGKDGIGYVCNFMGSKDFVKVFVIPKGSFEAKPWLRHIIISIGMKNKVDELAGRVGLLLECPALRRVEVVLHGGRSVLKCAIETISGAFKALAEKLGRRLMFSLAAQLKDDYPGSYYTHERFIGDLEKLETVAHDEDWISEDENLEIEGE